MRTTRLGLFTIKPVFGVYDQTGRNPACQVTETSFSIETLHVASEAIKNSRERLTKDAQAVLHLCCWSTPNDEAHLVKIYTMNTINSLSLIFCKKRILHECACLILFD